MKRKNIPVVAVCILLSSICHGQSTAWEAKPVIHNAPAEFSKESAVILLDERVHEYKTNDKKELYIQVNSHRLVKVMDDKGVEMFNRVYIPYGINTEVFDLKARTIQPDGKVVDLPSEKILDVEEEGKRYKKFALEGVEKNSEIEYSYKLVKAANFFGLEIFQYSSVPFHKVSFELFAPEHLLFSVKGSSGFTVDKDVVENAKRVIRVKGGNLPGLEEEKYGEAGPYAANIQYKLSYNLSRDKDVRLFTWNELAKRIYSNYTTFTEKELKAAGDFIKKAGISQSASEEEKIIALEDYIKQNINSDKDASGEDADKIEKLVKTKVASETGIISLFLACFEKLGINYQLVYPGKRDELPLEEEFENYRLTEDFIFYFPGTGNFVAPVASAMRYPFIPPYWAGTKGLFLKGTTIGTLKTAIASFDSIPMMAYEKNGTNMEVSLKMNSGMEQVLLHSKQILMGYSAMPYRPAFNLLPKDKLEDFTKDVVKSISKSDNITNIKTENTGYIESNTGKPLIIEADIESPELIEKAGNRYLLKIGDVIGPQEEMYQEKPRKLPVIIQYPHMLDREITFTIPDGYEIKNLSDINITVTDGPQTMGFISSYTLNGNELKILVHEFYKVTSYPHSMFEEFRKVINASADFNKVVLILVKK